MLIMALLASGAILATSVLGGDNELDTEGERLVTLIDYAREQAELQTREYGLWLEPDGYEFLGFDPRRGIWTSVEEDGVLRARELPEGLEMSLVIEGRPAILKRPRDEKEERVPHVMLFSNGDVTPFELTVRRPGTDEYERIASDDAGSRVTRESEDASG